MIMDCKLLQTMPTINSSRNWLHVTFKT